jgi:hypothetical protein
MPNNTPSPKKKSEEILPQIPKKTSKYSADTDEIPHAIHPVTGERIPYTLTKTGYKYPVAMLGGLPGAHRQTILTPELTQEITRLLLDGNYIETAVQAAGVHKDTFFTWMKNAERDTANGLYAGWNDAPDQSRYIAFADSVKLAFARAETDMVYELRHHRDVKTFQPIAWILERTRQQRYGQRQQVDVTHTVSGPDVPPPASTYDAWIERREKENAQLQAHAEDTSYTDVT